MNKEDQIEQAISGGPSYFEDLANIWDLLNAGKVQAAMNYIEYWMLQSK